MKFGRLLRKKSEFENKIKEVVGYIPYDLFLFELAVTHRSILGNDELNKGDNERLEFLGDAILSAVVSEYLYLNFSQMDEGDLSQLRSKVVSRQNLNLVAEKLGLSEIIRAKVNQRAMKNSVAGNTLEALIGAVFMDGGQKRAKKFVRRLITDFMNIEELQKTESNFKSKVIEYGQQHKKKIQFNCEESGGKSKTFKVFLSVDGEVVHEASSSSKKKAEQIVSQKFILGLNLGNGKA